MFFIIGVLKTFAIFTGKHLCWSFFLIKCRPSEQLFLIRHLQWPVLIFVHMPIHILSLHMLFFSNYFINDFTEICYMMLGLAKLPD